MSVVIVPTAITALLILCLMKRNTHGGLDGTSVQDTRLGVHSKPTIITLNCYLLSECD
jgi:hypothetical protein